MKLCIIILSILFHSSLCQDQDGLYFTLNGTTYPPGASVIITDIGEFTIHVPEEARTSLVCMTDNVNTQCCRNSDGGRVGEWFFPNGTMVPGLHGSSSLFRSGYTHQVRLNRRHNVLMPTGIFSCQVPDRNGSHHVGNVTIIAVNASIPTALKAAESDKIISVCTTLSVTPTTAATSRNIVVKLATWDNSAAFGSEYTAISTELTFSAPSHNDTVLCLNITIYDDNVTETDKNLGVTLTTQDSALLLGNALTIITILDDESKGIEDSLTSVEPVATISVEDLLTSTPVVIAAAVALMVVVITIVTCAASIIACTRCQHSSVNSKTVKNSPISQQATELHSMPDEGSSEELYDDVRKHNFKKPYKIAKWAAYENQDKEFKEPQESYINVMSVATSDKSGYATVRIEKD